jgi:sec-independent protein translocase protein TatA
LLVILVVVLVLFGGAQLPKLARSIGEAQREFRRGASGASGPAVTHADATGPPAAAGPAPDNADEVPPAT